MTRPSLISVPPPPARRRAVPIWSSAWLAAAFATSLHAQTHKVEAPERVTRAVAVYEWTGDFAKPDAARLVPVSLFINSHLEDAGVYLARPVPFALQSGDVYAIEQAGELKGTVDIDHARDVVTHRSAGDDNPVSAWYGYGSVLPPPPAPKQPVLAATANPSVIVGSSDPDRPTLVRRPPSTSTSPAGTNVDPTAPSTGAVPDNDPDRPTLRKRDPSKDAARRKADEAGSVTPMDTSLNDDPNRPAMRRGKPANLSSAHELTSLPPNLHQVAAVSDAASRSPHIFAREWSTPTERAETLAALQAIAQPRIVAYIAAYHLTPAALSTNLTAPSPNPSAPALRTAASTSRSTHHAAPKASPPAPPISLTSEQLTPYTLIYDGLPTFVYTAESPLAAGGPVYLTLVAQRLPSGELQVALSSVTDAGHLNRTPWLRLVDAVDPDASHRASLLFELRAQSTRQFALYDLVTAHAEQRFVTGVIQ